MLSKFCPILAHIRQILDSSKLKQFEDNNFKFNENDIKFSTRVENTVGKAEIARNEQFLIFPQCFRETCTADTKKPGLVYPYMPVNFIPLSTKRTH